jgi:hypothetical protein
MDQKCAICYSVMLEYTNINITRCKHKFHSNCIIRWSSTRNSCPCCREPLYETYETSYTTRNLTGRITHETNEQNTVPNFTGRIERTTHEELEDETYETIKSYPTRNLFERITHETNEQNTVPNFTGRIERTTHEELEDDSYETFCTHDKLMSHCLTMADYILVQRYNKFPYNIIKRFHSKYICKLCQMSGGSVYAMLMFFSL